MDDKPLTEVLVKDTSGGYHLVGANADLTAAEVRLMNLFARELRLRNALKDYRNSYDFIFIDCPPALNMLTVNAMAAATEVLVPIQCEYFALEGLRDLSEVVKQVQQALNPTLEIAHYLLTMSEGSKKLSSEVEAELRSAYGKKVFRSSIPYNVKLAEAPSMERSVLKHASTSKGAKAYRDVAKELSHGRTPKAR